MVEVRIPACYRTQLLLAKFSEGEKANAVGRCFRLALARGLSYIYCPAEDFAYLTHATCKRADAIQGSPANRMDFLTVEGIDLDHIIVGDMPEPAHAYAATLARSWEMPINYVLSLALRYGLCAWGCKQGRLGSVLTSIGANMGKSGLMADGVTYAGQAHFGDRSTQRACRHCAHFDPKANLRGNPTRGRCAKYADLMAVPVKSAPIFPVNAVACKYFEEKKNAKLKVVK